MLGQFDSLLEIDKHKVSSTEIGMVHSPKKNSIHLGLDKKMKIAACMCTAIALTKAE